MTRFMFSLTAFLWMACILQAAPHFTEVVPEGIPAEGDAPAVHWLDYDRDGKPDLFLNGRLYHNISTEGAFRFEDKTDASGVKGDGPCLCYDYDNDGWTDIVVAAEEPHVWRNKGDGTFEDTAAALGFKPAQPVMSLCAGDVDGDGKADLFVGKGEIWREGGEGSSYFPAEVWLNQGDKWVESAAAKGLDRKTYARAVLMADLNGDGACEIFVANYRLQPNLLWVSNGSGGFSEQGVAYGAAGQNEPEKYYDKVARRHFGPSFGHSIGACWTDYDNDGRLDIFVANLAHKYVGPGRKLSQFDYRGYICGDSEILHNLGNRKFVEGRGQLKVPTRPIGGRDVFKGDELWSGCAPADIDNDGWEDIFVPQIYNLPYAHSLLMMNQDGRHFANQARAAGLIRFDTYSGAWADVDGDGAMDLLTGGRPAACKPAQKAFYRNDGAVDNWMAVELRSGAGGTALGAMVTVKPAEGTPQVRVNASNVSTLSQQNDPVLHFGLERAEKAAVTVRWLDGTEETQEAQANGRLLFTRDGKEAPQEAKPAEEAQ